MGGGAEGHREGLVGLGHGVLQGVHVEAAVVGAGDERQRGARRDRGVVVTGVGGAVGAGNVHHDGAAAEGVQRGAHTRGAGFGHRLGRGVHGHNGRGIVVGDGHQGFAVPRGGVDRGPQAHAEALPGFVVAVVDHGDGDAGLGVAGGELQFGVGRDGGVVRAAPGESVGTGDGDRDVPAAGGTQGGADPGVLRLRHGERRGQCQRRRAVVVGEGDRGAAHGEAGGGAVDVQGLVGLVGGVVRRRQIEVGTARGRPSGDGQVEGGHGTEVIGVRGVAGHRDSHRRRGVARRAVESGGHGDAGGARAFGHVVRVHRERDGGGGGVAVGHVHRHRTGGLVGVVGAGDGVAECHVLVLGVGVDHGRDVHRLRGVPVGRREGQRGGVEGQFVAGVARDRDRDAAGGLGVEHHGVAVAAALGEVEFGVGQGHAAGVVVGDGDGGRCLGAEGGVAAGGVRQGHVEGLVRLVHVVVGHGHVHALLGVARCKGQLRVGRDGGVVGAGGGGAAAAGDVHRDRFGIRRRKSGAHSRLAVGFTGAECRGFHRDHWCCVIIIDDRTRRGIV